MTKNKFLGKLELIIKKIMLQITIIRINRCINKNIIEINKILNSVKNEDINNDFIDSVKQIKAQLTKNKTSFDYIRGELKDMKVQMVS